MAQLTADEFTQWAEVKVDRYHRWQRRFLAYVYRCEHQPIIRPLLSERLLVTGPEPRGEVRLPDHRLWLEQTARQAVREGLLRAAARDAEAELERNKRVAALLAPGGPAPTINDLAFHQHTVGRDELEHQAVAEYLRRGGGPGASASAVRA